jgi:hypothetical protein
VQHLAADVVNVDSRIAHLVARPSAENVEDATARLEEFITSLDVQLSEPINRGYPHILLGRDH